MSTKTAFLGAVTATTPIGSSCTFTAGSGVSTTNDTITQNGHGMQTGFGPIRFTQGGGNTLPTGVAAATNYWVVRVSANTFSLATSKANALAGTIVDITGAGSGDSTYRPTMQTLAEVMEDCLNEVLTAPGSRVEPVDVNISKFWDYTMRIDFSGIGIN